MSERWNISCADCGRFIFTEEREYVGADIKCIAGSYEKGFYDEIQDEFYCEECAKKRGFNRTKD